MGGGAGGGGGVEPPVRWVRIAIATLPFLLIVPIAFLFTRSAIAAMIPGPILPGLMAVNAILGLIVLLIARPHDLREAWQHVLLLMRERRTHQGGEPRAINSAAESDSRAVRLIRPPGMTTKAILDFLCSKGTMEEVFEPLIGDTIEEWTAAVADKRNTKAIWIRIRGCGVIAWVIFQRGPLALVGKALRAWLG